MVLVVQYLPIDRHSLLKKYKILIENNRISYLSALTLELWFIWSRTLIMLIFCWVWLSKHSWPGVSDLTKKIKISGLCAKTITLKNIYLKKIYNNRNIIQILRAFWLSYNSTTKEHPKYWYGWHVDDMLCSKTFSS